MKTMELLIFELAGYEFGIPLTIVEEVVPATKITSVPKSPGFLLGIAAVRGKVLGVIDAGERFGIGVCRNSHFLLCKVRGNLTAVTIDRPVLAGSVLCRELVEPEISEFRSSLPVDEKFLKDAYELFDVNEAQEHVATGRRFFMVNADLFVSHEMASKVGEV